MKAVVYNSYGSADVLRIEDIDKPEPADDEVLVRIRAASVNPYDWHYMTGLPYVGRAVMGLRKPKVNRLGCDLAGVVESAGGAVKKFKIGDEVFGMVNGAVPGQSELETGTLAEYVAVKQEWLEPKPSAMSFSEAASVPLAAITALQGLRDYGQLEPGQAVLVNGASGGVGTFAVQIAKAMGAEVSGVCSTHNVEMVRSIGADHVFDYTKDDFAKDDRRYDLLLDNVGNRSLSDCRRVLKPKGVYLSSYGQKENLWLGPLRKMFRMMLLNMFVSQKMVGLTQHRKQEDLAYLTGLINDSKMKAVVDREYPLDETAEAMRYLGEGHARGKVVVTV